MRMQVLTLQPGVARHRFNKMPQALRQALRVEGGRSRAARNYRVR